MNTLFARPFENIDETDLKDLVNTRKVREYASLDYKLTSYPHRHAGVVDLLADITAMANSRGGFIIIGVEEDTEALDGTPKRLVGIDNGDVEVNWIQSVGLSSIDEPITGFRVRDITLGNGKHCVVMQIPNSTKKPHMVVHENHRSFRIRHGRSNAYIGMREVRDMVINMTSYQESLISFIQKRVQANIEVAADAPFLLLLATPIYIGTDKINPLQKEYRDLLENPQGVPNQNYDGIYVGKSNPRIFGIEITPYSRLTINAFYRFCRLFRNGNFEYCENYSPSPEVESPTKAMPIYSYRIAVTLLHFLLIAQQVYALSEITDPIALNLILGNAAPSFLHPLRRSHWLPDNLFVWKDKLLSIDMTVSEIDTPNNIASALMDRLFNAYGYEKNLHFGDVNELLPDR